MSKSINIGEYCVECFQSVAFGSGNYINRISADRQAGAEYLHLDGWLCMDCQTDCDVNFAGADDE